MREIRFTKHALEQCLERGTDEAEVCEAIQIGSREPAKKGRILCCANVQFNREWQGRSYAIKQIAPVIVEEADAIVVSNWV